MSLPMKAKQARMKLKILHLQMLDCARTNCERKAFCASKVSSRAFLPHRGLPQIQDMIQALLGSQPAVAGRFAFDFTHINIHPTAS